MTTTYDGHQSSGKTTVVKISDGKLNQATRVSIWVLIDSNCLQLLLLLMNLLPLVYRLTKKNA